VLFASGKTWAGHYAGPTWELIDGSGSVGKIVSHAPAQARLTSRSSTRGHVRRGQGQLSSVSTIKRLNPEAASPSGNAARTHTLLGVPYTATTPLSQERRDPCSRRQ